LSIVYKETEFVLGLVVCKNALFAHQVVHKTGATDDKKLQGTLKRLGVQPIAGIEEVNIFKTDGNVVHFVNPKG
jgi:hypothetical protein